MAEETRETQLIVGWLRGGDSVNQRYWRDVVHEAVEQAEMPDAARRWSQQEALTAILAERLRDGITGDSYVIVADSGLYRDLISAALDNVDWWVVARALVAEYASQKGALGRKRRRPRVSATRRNAEIL